MNERLNRAINMKKTMKELTLEELQSSLFFMACGLKNITTILAIDLGKKKAIEALSDGIIQTACTICYALHEKEPNKIKDLLEELEKQANKEK